MSEEATDAAAADSDLDLEDPTPDVEALFRHYDQLYFRGALAQAGYTVQWDCDTGTDTSEFGSYVFGKSGKRNTITLYESVLQYHTNADLKNALLHLMIDAIVSVKFDRKICGHGPAFRAWRDAINGSSFEDQNRPPGGYNITTNHDFSPQEPYNIKGFNWWKCELCEDTLMRGSKLGPPSESCCIENVESDMSCGNLLCNWHNHKSNCVGSYAKMAIKPSEIPVQKKATEGTGRLLIGTSEVSKSLRIVQESNSAELKKNAIVTKPNAGGKLLSLVGSTSAKSPGIISSKKADKIHEDFQKSRVLRCNDAKSPGTSKSKSAGKLHKPEDVRKSKRVQRHLTGTSEMPKSQRTVPESGSIELQKSTTINRPNAEGKLLSVQGYKNTKSPGSSSSKKAGKRLRPEDIQKVSVRPASRPRRLKPEQDSVTSEKHKAFSAVGCNDAKSPGNSKSQSPGKRHKPELFDKASVLPASRPRRLKPELDYVASEKHQAFSLVGCNDAKSLGNSTSKNAGKWHKTEDAQESSASPATPQKKMKLKQDLVAPEKHGAFSLGNYRKTKPPESSTSKNDGKRNKPEDVQISSAPQKKEKVAVDFVASDILKLQVDSNVKPPGTGISNKEAKECKPEDVQKACVLLVTPPRKLKQDLIALEKNEILSAVGCNNAEVLGTISAKKTCKQCEPEDTEKTSALLAAHQSKHKQLTNISSSVKAGKQHGHDDIQKSTAQIAAPRSKLKQSTLIALEKNENSSVLGCSNAKILDTISSKPSNQREPEDTLKTSALHAAPQSKPTQPNEIRSSVKAGKQHGHEDIQITSFQPAGPRSKLKQSTLVAPEKQKTKFRTRKSAKPKEYPVKSAWLNYCESEGSSDSTEPLVNKRTERRKREREQKRESDQSVQTYSRSKKRSASGIVSSRTRSPEDDSSQQAGPPSPCLDIAAHQLHAHGDHSQTPAPCSITADQVIPLQPADAPGLTLSSPDSSHDLIVDTRFR